jgi:hypothetical protein
MRKNLHRAVVLCALTILPLSVEAAKPQYCTEALRRCIAECNQLPAPLNTACQGGCAVGYLTCGY